MTALEKDEMFWFLMKKKGKYFDNFKEHFLNFILVRQLKKFLFSWNTQIKFKNFKVFEKMLFFIVVLKSYNNFSGFFFFYQL